MCGIAGILGRDSIDEGVLRRITSTIEHRGPDGNGTWVSDDRRLGLGHRRLAIIDLSESGNQPMQSADGSLALCYNGEIYNHLALRRELETDGKGRELRWRGHSDTETLVECISRWGLERTLEKCVGMFAFALWDRRAAMLSLVRDRFGEKPLYYGRIGSDLVFASELKGLAAHPSFEGTIDRRSLRLLAARSYIPAPFSIYKGVHKVRPGEILSFQTSRTVPSLSEAPCHGDMGNPSCRSYWSYEQVMADGLGDQIACEAEAAERLEGALAESVRGQAIADVPVGAFLSGGVDSSTVASLYSRYGSGSIQTFSIGFEDEAYDESRYARAISEHLGTRHHEMVVTKDDILGVLPDIPRIFCEPFADSSQIPTILVSRFARRHVTVALSGDGGDELFGGYNRHFALPAMWRRLQRIPRPVRWVVGKPLSHVPANWWTSASALLPGGRRRSHVGDRIRKGFMIAGEASDLNTVYQTFLDDWHHESPLADSDFANLRIEPSLRWLDPAAQMMYADTVGYLPDDILCKVDRSAMSASLETRIPMLDHRVAALAARIPTHMKIRNGVGKHILRELLGRHVPESMLNRRKAGFAVPIGPLLRKELRPWAEELLSETRLRNGGFFDPSVIQRRWRRHLSGQEDAAPALWSILMFQAWLDSPG